MTNFISIPIPIGAYSSYSITHQPNGIIDDKQNDNLSFNNENHYLAQLIWFDEDGFFEYTIENPLPKNSDVKKLRLFFEACSEAWGYRLDQKTDLSIYVNNKKIGRYTINGDWGERGKYTPKWWPTANTQYGEPLLVEVREDGTYITIHYSGEGMEENIQNLNFEKISNITISDLNLNQGSITLKIGVDKDAEHRDGMNLFGEKFGNYPKTLTLGFECDGEEIFQPTISEIIDNPENFENKMAILSVHPGGWSCPPGKGTNIPEGFSRSATVIYDETGCLYGNGKILIGRILSPELHTINVPGNETIVVEGKIKLDKNKIPFILP